MNVQKVSLARSRKVGLRTTQTTPGRARCVWGTL